MNKPKPPQSNVHITLPSAMLNPLQVMDLANKVRSLLGEDECGMVVDVYLGSHSRAEKLVTELEAEGYTARKLPHLENENVRPVVIVSRRTS